MEIGSNKFIIQDRRKNIIMYYVMLELIPRKNVIKKKKGAFLNCWTSVKTKKYAIIVAKKYANRHGWKVIRIMEVYKVNKERYVSDKEILEVYNEACRERVSGIFYTW